MNPLFVASLAILLLNDFYLKNAFPGFVTGKLSDLSGIIVCVLLFSALFPERKPNVYILVALSFVFWKSPLSSGVIDLINETFPANYARVVDYGDLFCLFALFPLYFFEPENRAKASFQRVFFGLLSGISLFAILATSRARMPDYGYVYVGKELTFKTDKAGFLKLLEQEHVSFKESGKYMIKGEHFMEGYELEKMIIGSDTVYQASIGIRQKNKGKLVVRIEKIQITEKGRAMILEDYSKQDSITKAYKIHTIDYFKSLKEK